MTEKKQRAGIFDETDSPLDLSTFQPAARTGKTESARFKQAAEQAAAVSGFSRRGTDYAPAPVAGRRAEKEAIHTFNVRLPLSKFEHLEAWALKVSPKSSIHALVVRAIEEKLDRLDRGEDDA